MLLSHIEFFIDSYDISSINIIQCREYSIEERLNILKGFYGEIEKLRLEDDFESIEDIFDEIRTYLERLIDDK